MRTTGTVWLDKLFCALGYHDFQHDEFWGERMCTRCGAAQTPGPPEPGPETEDE